MRKFSIEGILCLLTGHNINPPFCWREKIKIPKYVLGIKDEIVLRGRGVKSAKELLISTHPMLIQATKEWIEKIEKGEDKKKILAYLKKKYGKRFAIPKIKNKGSASV